MRDKTDKLNTSDKSDKGIKGESGSALGYSKGVYMLTLTGLLSAVALILSALENMLPDFPLVIPGFKLGLSNITLMFSLELFPLPCSLVIVLVKAAFALITRGAVAGVLSLSGGLASTVTMWLLIRARRISFGCLGVGIAGAFMHNTGQLIAAFAFAGDAVKIYFPVLSAVSFLTGTLTALLYYIIMPLLRKIPQISQRC